MKITIIALLLVVLHSSLAAQDSQYKTLDELGWKMTSFVIPDRLTDLDTGVVNYLVTLNNQGKVTAVKILKNTFDVKAEKLWREAIRRCAFERADEYRNEELRKRYSGTTIISRTNCNQPVGTPEQLELFHKRGQSN